jgi:hypothetical protein
MDQEALESIERAANAGGADDAYMGVEQMCCSTFDLSACSAAALELRAEPTRLAAGATLSAVWGREAGRLVEQGHGTVAPQGQLLPSRVHIARFAVGSGLGPSPRGLCVVDA